MEQAGTVVCEPIHRFRLEAPADTFGALAPLLARLRAVPKTQESRGASYVLEGAVPAARVARFQQYVPGLTRGEGILECTFDRYEPISGTFPTRPRTDLNPLNRKEYLLHVNRRRVTLRSLPRLLPTNGPSARLVGPALPRSDRPLVRLGEQQLDPLEGLGARVQHADPELLTVGRVRHDRVERGEVVLGPDASAFAPNSPS